MKCLAVMLLVALAGVDASSISSAPATGSISMDFSMPSHLSDIITIASDMTTAHASDSALIAYTDLPSFSGVADLGSIASLLPSSSVTDVASTAPVATVSLSDFVTMPSFDLTGCLNNLISIPATLAVVSMADVAVSTVALTDVASVPATVATVSLTDDAYSVASTLAVTDVLSTVSSVAQPASVKMAASTGSSTALAFYVSYGSVSSPLFPTDTATEETFSVYFANLLKSLSTSASMASTVPTASIANVVTAQAASVPAA